MTMLKLGVLVLCLVAWMSAVPSEAQIQCYSCVYSYHPEADTSCLDDPGSQPQIACPAGRTCYVQSQWDPFEGWWRSLARGCEDFSGTPDYCTPAPFVDRLTTCSTDLCNDRIAGPGGDQCSAEPGKPEPPGDGGEAVKASAVAAMVAWGVALAMAVRD